MPGKIKVKVLAGRNLPVMDRASDTTDAFVEIKFGNLTHKTDVCRKSLNPHWSSTEWYRFEVDESELQDEPLQLRLMDHDTYSANDAIGKVIISLAPLLAREPSQAGAKGLQRSALMSGWIPVFDTMHGIRGELNVIVKVELFSDYNKYKISSCGVQFFHCSSIPPGYRAISIHGFVEELVINDDPEYQWIDKIRTPRASNEARQVAFIKLSNQVQRLVGVKAAELGANAVVGYTQDFDLEGEAGVVARAIGTAVTLVPLPSADQPFNIPPCTQQQLRKYLDILATGDESITDLNEYFQNHQDELQRLLKILNPKTPALLDETENPDEDEKSLLTRQSSVKSYTGSVSIYQDEYISQKSLRNISEDQTDLNKLLKGNEGSDSDSSGPLQKIKKMKTSLFTRKFGSLRSRKSDKQDDQVSIKSNSSDNSRISLTDIKKEFKKLKRIKKPKFRKGFTNPKDEGIGMASILARSVIHAHTSLACIAETQDSEHSPNSTMRRTSESEPTINMSDEDKGKINLHDRNVIQCKPKIPDIHASLQNIPSAESVIYPGRKLSESCPATPMASRNDNLLKLPGEPGYFGSSLSGESSEVYSSSEEDDDSSSQRTDTEKTIETTSSVVQTVLSKDVDPDLIAKMDRKLSILDGVAPDPIELKRLDSVKENDDLQTCGKEPVNKINEFGASNTKQVVDIPEVVPVNEIPDSVPSKKKHHFEFINPFVPKKESKSVSAPTSPVQDTSFVYRTSKRIKNQLSKFTNSPMIKSISHYSLLPKKKQSNSNTTMNQPRSSSDVIFKVPSETVLGSPFMSYADLMSLDSESVDTNKPYTPSKYDEKSYGKAKMYIGSEPVSRASVSGPSSIYPQEEDSLHEYKRNKPVVKPSGLVHTAMETILMDKVQSLLVPTSPEPRQSKEQQFFDDVTEKLGRVEDSQNIDSHQNKSNVLKQHETTDNHKKDSLLHIALQTIFVDKVQTLLTPTTPDNNIQLQDKHLFRETNEKSKTPSERSVTPEISHTKFRERSTSLGKRDKHHGSLLDTAMKTILLDKVQTLVPETPEPLLFDERVFDYDRRKKSRKSESKDSLLHTAMETILIDKVQALLPSQTVLDDEKVDGFHMDRLKESSQLPEHVSHQEPVLRQNNAHKSSLLETAMKTMLFEKVTTLVSPESAMTVDNESEQYTDDITSTKQHDNVSVKKGLIDSAVETMLLDKAQMILISPTSSSLDQQSDSSIIENDRHQKPVLKNLDCSLSTVSTESRNESDRKTKKLVRQDSFDSVTRVINDDSQKMSKDTVSNNVFKVTQSKPVLQHFHPILSGAPLETIPSLPESSLDHAESLDVAGEEEAFDSPSECGSETNIASACDNSHAACHFDRIDPEKEWELENESPRHARHESYGRDPLLAPQPLSSSLNSASTPITMHRRSSDSDLSVTPKGGSLNTSLGNVGIGALLRPLNTSNLEMLDYPFLTMTEFRPGFILHIGGVVCSRSVKLVDSEGDKATRQSWWAELRTELRSHARALRCNAVIAYTESTAVCEDVCVLSASGTAAVINMECAFDYDKDSSANDSKSDKMDEAESDTCSISHVPYSLGPGPYEPKLTTCGVCKRCRVPAVLLATCAKPARLPAYAKAVTLTAVALRVRRQQPAAEPGARDISDQLPFLEYELHKLLLAKLRMQGANAIFSLETQISIGERCVMALASGIAFKLPSLPPPTPPKINVAEPERGDMGIQKAIIDTFEANNRANGYDLELPIEPAGDPPSLESAPDSVESEELPPLDLSTDKEACILELDEDDDVETARFLAIRRTLMQVYTGSLKCVPAATPYAFAQVWRARLVLPIGGAGAGTAERHVARALDGVTYKLRRLHPCAIATPRFQVELPEDEIQLIMTGTAIRLEASEHNAPFEAIEFMPGPRGCDVDGAGGIGVGDFASGYHLGMYASEVNFEMSGCGAGCDAGYACSCEGGEDANDSPRSQGSRISRGSRGSRSRYSPLDHGDADDEVFALDEDYVRRRPRPPAASSLHDSMDDRNVITDGHTPTTVSLTTLSAVAGSRNSRRICALRLLFVRETTAVRELGGLSGFLHTFTCEVLAIVRAYTAALGGNTLTSFYLTQLMLQDNAHKNQGQCLLSVGGDVVQITY